MPQHTRLEDAIRQFDEHRRAVGRTPSTRRNDRYILTRFLTTTGNIYLRNIEPRHVDRYMIVASETRSTNTRIIDLATLSQFFGWARGSRLMARDSDPLAGRKGTTEGRPERRRVPVTDFGRLLDAATHPRDRMVLALGLYLFLRASEVVTLRVCDVSLSKGEVRVKMPKTKGHDVMPISRELDGELRRWLTFYTEACGEPEPTWHLVPALERGSKVRDRESGRWLYENRHLSSPNPTHRAVRTERIVQGCLRTIGFPLRGVEGESLREGVHTLRRSGARALFDALADDGGYDRPLRIVQSMLHHQSLAQTEHYIGLSYDRETRDDLTRGKTMFPAATAAGNVVRLEEARGQGNGGAAHL